MKSKVKVIAECKEYTNDYGTTYYHNIEMENGDKVNIGKKKKLEIGQELEYEWVGELGQHEYTKAKTPKPVSSGAGNKDDVQTYIIRQSSLKIALDFLNVNPNVEQGDFTLKYLKALAEDLTNYVLNGLD